MSDTKWEQGLLTEIAHQYIKEKQSRRRWGIFFKLMFLLLTVWFMVSLYILGRPDQADINAPHTALIDLDGAIFSDSDAKAQNFVSSLRKAYKSPGNKGILVRINSPGGSPVQAHYMYNEINRMRKKHPKIKVYAVCTEMCASAAYYVAAAADEIYADQGSIVGSIGVIYNGFGFTGLMDKVGVDRRVITAGKNKAFMDPFSPKKEENVKILTGILDKVHDQFKTAVIQGRGKRLKVSDNVFSGLFWLGTDAKEMGLIDGLGSPGEVSRDVIKQEKVIDYTLRPSFIEQIAKRFGIALSQPLGLTQHPDALLQGIIERG